MQTAYCFTPDRAFFVPAVRAIASLVEAEPEGGHEIVLVCEPSDVPRGFDKLAGGLRDRIELLTVDFKRFDKRTSSRAGASRAPSFAASFSTSCCRPASSASFRSIPTCSSSARGSSGSKASILAEGRSPPRMT